jgi:hypothetical protein
VVSIDRLGRTNIDKDHIVRYFTPSEYRKIEGGCEFRNPNWEQLMCVKQNSDIAMGAIWAIYGRYLTENLGNYGFISRTKYYSHLPLSDYQRSQLSWQQLQ